jgi:hypothetical protein
MAQRNRFRLQACFALTLGVTALLAAACSSSPSATSGNTPTTAASTTSTTAAADGSETNPIPFGQTGDVDGWKVKVISVASEAAEPFTSTPPPEGYAFMVFTLEVTRTDSKPESPVLLTPKLLGPSKAERGLATTPFCLGGTPYNDQVHQGGTVQTGGCISVPTSDVGHLVMGVGFINDKWFATM